MLGKHVWEITSQYTAQDIAEWQAYQKVKAQLGKRKRKPTALKTGKRKS